MVPQRERPQQARPAQVDPEPEGDGGHQRRHVRGGPPGRLGGADLAARLRRRGLGGPGLHVPDARSGRRWRRAHRRRPTARHHDRGRPQGGQADPPRQHAPRRCQGRPLHDTASRAAPRRPPGVRRSSSALEDVLRPNGQQTVRVTDVRRGEGNTPLAPGMAVLSVGGRTNDWVRKMHVGDRYVLKTSVVRNVNNSCGGVIDAAPGWGDVVETLGGNEWTAGTGASRRRHGPSIQPAPSATRARASASRPTAACSWSPWTGDDPATASASALKEMGKLMLTLGAAHAFNLDGGGSTVMARRFTSHGQVQGRQQAVRRSRATGHPGAGRLPGHPRRLTLAPHGAGTPSASSSIGSDACSSRCQYGQMCVPSP